MSSYRADGTGISPLFTELPNVSPSNSRNISDLSDETARARRSGAIHLRANQAHPSISRALARIAPGRAVVEVEGTSRNTTHVIAQVKDQVTQREIWRDRVKNAVKSNRGGTVIALAAGTAELEFLAGLQSQHQFPLVLVYRKLPADEVRLAGLEAPNAHFESLLDQVRAADQTGTWCYERRGFAGLAGWVGSLESLYQVGWNRHTATDNHAANHGVALIVSINVEYHLERNIRSRITARWRARFIGQVVLPEALLYYHMCRQRGRALTLQDWDYHCETQGYHMRISKGVVYYTPCDERILQSERTYIQDYEAWLDLFYSTPRQGAKNFSRAYYRGLGDVYVIETAPCMESAKVATVLGCSDVTYVPDIGAVGHRAEIREACGAVVPTSLYNALNRFVKAAEQREVHLGDTASAVSVRTAVIRAAQGEVDQMYGYLSEHDRKVVITYLALHTRRGWDTSLRDAARFERLTAEGWAGLRARALVRLGRWLQKAKHGSLGQCFETCSSTADLQRARCERGNSMSALLGVVASRAEVTCDTVSVVGVAPAATRTFAAGQVAIAGAPYRGRLLPAGITFAGVGLTNGGGASWNALLPVTNMVNAAQNCAVLAFARFSGCHPTSTGTSEYIREVLEAAAASQKNVLVLDNSETQGAYQLVYTAGELWVFEITRGHVTLGLAHLPTVQGRIESFVDADGAYHFEAKEQGLFETIVTKATENARRFAENEIRTGDPEISGDFEGGDKWLTWLCEQEGPEPLQKVHKEFAAAVRAAGGLKTFRAEAFFINGYPGSGKTYVVEQLFKEGSPANFVYVAPTRARVEQWKEDVAGHAFTHEKAAINMPRNVDVIFLDEIGLMGHMYAVWLSAVAQARGGKGAIVLAGDLYQVKRFTVEGEPEWPPDFMQNLRGTNLKVTYRFGPDVAACLQRIYPGLRSANEKATTVTVKEYRIEEEQTGFETITMTNMASALLGGVTAARTQGNSYTKVMVHVDAGADKIPLQRDPRGHNMLAHLGVALTRVRGGGELRIRIHADMAGCLNAVWDQAAPEPVAEPQPVSVAHNGVDFATLDSSTAKELTRHITEAKDVALARKFAPHTRNRAVHSIAACAARKATVVATAVAKNEAALEGDESASVIPDNPTKLNGDREVAAQEHASIIRVTGSGGTVRAARVRAIGSGVATTVGNAETHPAYAEAWQGAASFQPRPFLFETSHETLNVPKLVCDMCYRGGVRCQHTFDRVEEILKRHYIFLENGGLNLDTPNYLGKLAELLPTVPQMTFSFDKVMGAAPRQKLRLLDARLQSPLQYQRASDSIFNLVTVGARAAHLNEATRIKTGMISAVNATPLEDKVKIAKAVVGNLLSYPEINERRWKASAFLDTENLVRHVAEHCFKALIKKETVSEEEQDTVRKRALGVSGELTRMAYCVANEVAKTQYKNPAETDAQKGTANWARLKPGQPVIAALPDHTKAVFLGSFQTRFVFEVIQWVLEPIFVAGAMKGHGSESTSYRFALAVRHQKRKRGLTATRVIETDATARDSQYDKLNLLVLHEMTQALPGIEKVGTDLCDYIAQAVASTDIYDINTTGRFKTWWKLTSGIPPTLDFNFMTTVMEAVSECNLHLRFLPRKQDGTTVQIKDKGHNIVAAVITGDDSNICILPETTFDSDLNNRYYQLKVSEASEYTVFCNFIMDSEGRRFPILARVALKLLCRTYEPEGGQRTIGGKLKEAVRAEKPIADVARSARDLMKEMVDEDDKGRCIRANVSRGGLNAAEAEVLFDFLKAYGRTSASLLRKQMQPVLCASWTAANLGYYDRRGPKEDITIYGDVEKNPGPRAYEGEVSLLKRSHVLFRQEFDPPIEGNFHLFGAITFEADDAPYFISISVVTDDDELTPYGCLALNFVGDLRHAQFERFIKSQEIQEHFEHSPKIKEISVGASAKVRPAARNFVLTFDATEPPQNLGDGGGPGTDLEGEVSLPEPPMASAPSSFTIKICDNVRCNENGGPGTTVEALPSAPTLENGRQ